MITPVALKNGVSCATLHYKTNLIFTNDELKIGSLYMTEDDAREILLEYYKQTMEDCRTVGDQKYKILVSIALVLGGIIYTVIRINDFDKAYELNKYIYLIIILLTLIVIMLFWTFLFLWGHLPILDSITRKIEELHRDILFKEMGDKYLFCWDDISENCDAELKEFLIKNFNLRWVKNAKIEIYDDGDNMTIKVSSQVFPKLKNLFLKSQIHLIQKIRQKICNIESLSTTYTGNFFRKSLYFTLNKERTTVTLIINGMIDEFNVKKDEEKLKVFESELKYRFREIYPHSNVLRPSLILQVMISLIIISVIFLTYYYY